MGIAGRAAWVAIVLGACGKKSDPAPEPAPRAASGAAVVEAAAPPVKVDPLAVAVVTEVPSGKLDPPPQGPLLTAAMLQLSFEGAPMARVMGGKIDPKAIDPVSGRIAPLASFLESWVKTAPGPRVVKLAVVPHLPARIVVDVMGTFQAIAQRDFALIVRNADGPGALPLRGPETGAPADAVQVVLSFTSDKLVLWSLSGREGTLRSPKLTVRRDDGEAWDRVRTALAEIAARRPQQRDLVIMIDDGVKTSELVAAMLAVRHDRDGKELFGDVRLASGFEAPPEPVAMQVDEAARFADLLTGGMVGPSSEDLSARRPGSDLAEQLDEVRADGAAVAVGGGIRGSRSDGATATGPNVDSSDVMPAGRISLKRKEALEATTLTADVVASKVLSAYLAGVKRCYKQALRTDPALTGDLALALRVNETGRVVDVKVSAPGDDLDDCVAGQAANWRFSLPKDDDGEPTEARFELRFGLVPE